MIEPHEVRHNETEAGTKYQIEKWTCPECNQEKSTLIIDGEWCHGDSQGATFGPKLGQKWEGCVECLTKMASNAEITGSEGVRVD